MDRTRKTQRQIRLSDATWEALDAVAARERLLHGGQPSRAKAVEWLIAADFERRSREKESVCNS